MRLLILATAGSWIGGALLAPAILPTAVAKTAGPAPVTDLAAGHGAIWTWMNTYELIRLDPRTNRITARTDTRPALITDLAAGAEGVWGAGVCGRVNCAYGTLVQFDSRTGQRRRPLTRLGLRPRAIAVGYGSIWVLGGRRVLRVDPRTRRPVGTPIWIGRDARDIAAGAGAVWVTTGERPGPTGAPLCDLVGIDPATARVIRRQPIGCGTTAEIAVGLGSVWVASAGGRGLARIRPFGERLALPGVQLPGESSDVATAAGRVWVAGVRPPVPGTASGRGVLTAFDPAGGRLGRPLTLGSAEAGQVRVATGFGAAWVANAPAGTITRVDLGSGRVVARIRP